MKKKKAAYAKKRKQQQKELARICRFDIMLINNIDYEYLAFPLATVEDLYKDDFDSSDEQENSDKDKKLHGFEMSRFIFQNSHIDQF